MDYTDIIQMISSAAGALGISKLYSYLRNKNNNETEVLKKQQELEHEDIEELKKENESLKAQVRKLNIKLKQLEIERVQTLDKLNVVITIVEELAEDNPNLLSIIDKIKPSKDESV